MMQIFLHTFHYLWILLLASIITCKCTAKYSQQTPHSSPFRVSYGVPFVNSVSDFCLIFITITLVDVISCHIGTGVLHGIFHCVMGPCNIDVFYIYFIKCKWFAFKIFLFVLFIYYLLFIYLSIYYCLTHLGVLILCIWPVLTFN